MAAPTYFGHGTAVSPAGATGSLNYPASIAANDILIAHVLTGVGADTTPASGFVSLVTGTDATDGGQCAIYWKRATGSETAANWTNLYWGVMHVIRGCPTSGNPWNATATNSATSTTSISYPSVTSTIDNSLIFLAMVGSGTGTQGTLSNGGLSSITEQIDSPLTNGRGDAATGLRAVAGATGVTTGALSSSGWQARVAIAFSPNSVDGTLATTLGNVTSDIEATVILPNGPIDVTLGNVVADFAGSAAPPAGTIDTTLGNVSASFAATSDSGGPVSATLGNVSAAMAASVNPIGSLAVTLGAVSVGIVTETRPFGDQVIVVDAEKRSLRITDDDIIFIYADEVTDA